MCRPISAVGVFTGGGVRLYYSKIYDSHSEICKEFGLKDMSVLGSSQMAKIEFVPNGDYRDLSCYKLTIDEQTIPQWCDEHRDEIEKQCRAMVREILSEPIHPIRLIALNVSFPSGLTSIGGDCDLRNYAHPLPSGCVVSNNIYK